ncbi:MAG TPA: hypothetical protein VFH82_07745 [Gemmatimonadota bacterium]|jgi:hypothetical protein|nr:hypothetical protein [Gemmatimonadota bacterium]
MRKRTSFTLAALAALAFAVPALAQPQAPAAPFQPVSALVDLPDFIPGMGSLYVDPATLPAGPFLAYDREGHLVSTIYMVPLAAMTEHQNFDGLAVGDGEVDHVDIQYNAGHPGVAEPHYHVVLWYVSPEAAAALQ